MQFIVRAIATDEYTDTSDAESSLYYGPYRSREAADKIAAAIEKLDGKGSCDFYAFVIPLTKPGIRTISHQLRDGLRG